jgi:hypothetical protein
MAVRELDCDVEDPVTLFVAVYEHTATKEAFSQGLRRVFAKVAYGLEFDGAREGSRPSVARAS